MTTTTKSHDARDRRIHGDVAAHQVPRVIAKVEHVAERLRDLADDVDRIAKRGPYTTSVGPDRYTPMAALVGEVVHRVTWGVTNLSLDQLAREAAEADAHAARAITPTADPDRVLADPEVERLNVGPEQIAAVLAAAGITATESAE